MQLPGCIPVRKFLGALLLVLAAALTLASTLGAQGGGGVLVLRVEGAEISVRRVRRGRVFEASVAVG